MSGAQGAMPVWAGAHVALLTPFDASGAVDYPAFERLCAQVAGAGVGLVPCGTTGETPTLTGNEVDRVIATAVRVADGRVPVMAGTGSNNTRQTVAATRRASELGVDGALVVVPYYNRPPQRSLMAHFTRVADEGGVPVILYNVPSRTGTNLEAATALALAAHPNIVAIKEAAGSMDQVRALVAGAPAGFAVLSGDDDMTCALIKAGGHGVVSVAGNLFPAALKALTDAGLAGDWAQADAHHARLAPLFSALFQTANPIPVKAASAWRGLGTNVVRMPLMADELTDAMAETLRAALRHAVDGQ